ncbi:MAG: hypothetical protein OQK73_11115 [Gammaproteobacteria bacterium]|nr:hypothetical protein [Gammaproteobacteria bacterium]
MRTLILSVMFLASFNVYPNEAEDNKAVIEMMVVAKATGMCGVFGQLINFQQTTKMQGGDEFIVRFLKTEAARLGHTLESLTGQCPDVVKKYNSYMKLFGYEQ